MSHAPARHVVLIAAALIASAAVLSSPASAQDPSTGDIVNSLQPKTKFRSFDPNQAAKDAKQADLVKRLQNAKTRQITVEERQEITEVVEENDLPAIDLEVFFNFDSAEITPEALPILKKLGAALSDEKLKGSVFLVVGPYRCQGLRRLQSVPVRPARQVGGRILDREFPYRSQAACRHRLR